MSEDKRTKIEEGLTAVIIAAMSFVALFVSLGE